MVFELPRDETHGDLATNAAMVLAKQAGMKPSDLAKIFAVHLAKLDGANAVDIAGPGFINLRIAPTRWTSEITTILAAGDAYGKNNIGGGAPVNIEFVSANPTGPLHAAHARGAVIGDALAGLMAFCGWQVTREYTVSMTLVPADISYQIGLLAVLSGAGRDIGEIPAGLYPGLYLTDVGAMLAAKYGDTLDKPEDDWLSTIRLRQLPPLWGVSKRI